MWLVSSPGLRGQRSELDHQLPGPYAEDLPLSHVAWCPLTPMALLRPAHHLPWGTCFFPKLPARPILWDPESEPLPPASGVLAAPAQSLRGRSQSGPWPCFGAEAAARPHGHPLHPASPLVTSAKKVKRGVPLTASPATLPLEPPREQLERIGLRRLCSHRRDWWLVHEQPTH